MLPLADLITFSDNYITTRTNLEASIVVANDSEVAKQIEDLANANNNCTLITVIPSHDSDFKNEDAKKYANNLMFFVVKKTSIKGGNTLRLDNFTLCQTEIQALAEHIVSLTDNFGTDCLFKDIDVSSITITPIANYFGQNGYLLELTTKTTS